MHKDIISYKLAKDISEEHLLKVADEIIKTWMSKLKGFQKWEIHKNSDGGYTDIVYWNSKEDAKNAEKDMMNIPNGAEWFSCYEEGSVSGKYLTLIKEFK